MNCDKRTPVYNNKLQVDGEFLSHIETINYNYIFVYNQNVITVSSRYNEYRYNESVYIILIINLTKK